MFGNIRKTLAFAGALSEGIVQRHLGLIAAGVGFYSLFAIFPATTATVTLWGYFANPDIVEEQIASFRHILPPEFSEIVEGQVRAIANGPKQVLGWASIVSMLTALWATRAGVAAMIGGLNAVYRVPPRRGLRHQLVSFLLTLLLIGVALVSLAVVVIAPIIISFLPLGVFSGVLIFLVRWAIGAGVVLLGIGLLYRLGPNRRGNRTPLVTAGSALAAGVWAAVSVGFSLYLSHFSRYNEIYGSLGAVIALLMWFYLSAFIVLLGALVNAEAERFRQRRSVIDTARDESDGPGETEDLQMIEAGR